MPLDIKIGYMMLSVLAGILLFGGCYLIITHISLQIDSRESRRYWNDSNRRRR